MPAFIDWGNIITEVIAIALGAMITGLLGGFGLWLNKSYKRLTSIDNAVQELHVIANIVYDHERRIVNLEGWKEGGCQANK